MAKKSRRKTSNRFFTSTELLNFFKGGETRAVTFTEIAQSLDVPSDQRRELRQALRHLLAERQIVKLDRRHYSLPPSSKVIVGRVQAHRDGYGFLVPEDSRLPDIFLGRQEARDLMHRDRVALHVRRKGRAPRVVEVLERAQRRIVGRYEAGLKFDFVVPDEPKLVQKVRIPKSAAGGASDNKIVLVEITRYPTKQEGPEGKILEVLGDAEDPRLDSEIIIHKYGLPDAFPPAVLQEATAIPQKISAAGISVREDLRDLNFFTVDGETARDYDDAVAISRQAGGEWKLWVAIADVSHYVKEGSPLDQEAFRRGTSVYFPERSLPMLPPQLSSGICSLNPNQDRLCLTAAMGFDSQGRRIEVHFSPSVIRSRSRLTYTMVKEMLLQGNRQLVAHYPSIYADLLSMAELCTLLRAQRRERGSLDFDLPEPEVILDVQGQIEEIVRSERHLGHQIIEEFMISANEAVAQFLARQGSPALHRVHEPPEEKKIEEFKQFVAHLGYRFSPPGKLHSGMFQRILGQARGKPEEKVVNYLLLRCMKQARYSEKELGHFALASAHYLHFTSPIRRYPDLLVHRILKEVLAPGGIRGKWRQHWQNKLPAIAEHSSQRERVAMEAEREIVDRKKVQFMRDKIGQEFAGYISGVVPFGLFVELEDFFIEGLVPLIALPEDRYQFVERRQALVGERKRKVFRLGDRVKVKVEAANLERRQVDFSLVQ